MTKMGRGIEILLVVVVFFYKKPAMHFIDLRLPLKISKNKISPIFPGICQVGHSSKKTKKHFAIVLEKRNAKEAGLDRGKEELLWT